MIKAYIEPNIINWARRVGWTGDALRKTVAGHGLEPYFGIHGIYELARGFLFSEAKDDAVRNFQILHQLNPVYCPTTQMLINREVDYLKTGAVVIPILDAHNHASAKYQVGVMARGSIEGDGERFIDKREKDIDEYLPRFTAYQLHLSENARNSSKSRLATFEDAFKSLEPEIPNLIRQILKNRVTVIEAKEIFARFDTFPTIRTTTRANLYLWAIPLMNQVAPSRDKLDDYRHIIEASYSHAFLTGDEQLARTVPRINPGQRVFTWADIYTV